MNQPLIISLVLFFTALMLRAQTTEPAGPGAEALQALRTLIDAVQTGRPEDVRRHLHASQVPNGVGVLAAVDLAEAIGRVRAAVAEKIGAEDAELVRLHIISERLVMENRVIRDRPLVDPLSEARVSSASNTAARIQFGDAVDNFVIMRRIDGVWKLSIEESLGEGGRQTLEALVAVLDGTAQRINDIAARVSAGRFTSVHAVNRALNSSAERVSP